MRRKYSALIFFLIATAACFCQQQKAPSEYASLLARAKNADVTVDFKQLRLSYMDSPERHRAKDTDKQKRDMFKSLNGKDYKKAVADAEVVLTEEYVDMDAHFVEYISYMELHEDEKSNFHHSIFRGLLKSIIDSGDGKSAKTAYVVISTHEEYVLLQVLGLKPGQQSLHHEDGHNYDVLQAADPKSNATVTLYFNVDIPFKHYLN
jgi:hypothetical protein